MVDKCADKARTLLGCSLKDIKIINDTSLSYDTVRRWNKITSFGRATFSYLEVQQLFDIASPDQATSMYMLCDLPRMVGISLSSVQFIP